MMLTLTLQKGSNPWFNFKLTFDAKTESVSDIVKLMFGLFMSFRNAFQYAFGKLSKKNITSFIVQSLSKSIKLLSPSITAIPESIPDDAANDKPMK